MWVGAWAEALSWTDTSDGQSLQVAVRKGKVQYVDSARRVFWGLLSRQLPEERSALRGVTDAGSLENRCLLFEEEKVKFQLKDPRW